MRIPPLLAVLSFLIFVGCAEKEIYFASPAVPKALADSALFVISFESETLTFTKLADEENGKAILEKQPASVQHLIKTMAIPRVVRDRQTLVIRRDFSFELVIEKVPAHRMPQQEQFEGPPVEGLAKEAVKIVLNDETMKLYDEDGKLLREYPAKNNHPFTEAIYWLKHKPEFAKHVDIASLFVRLSANAHNFLNEKTKDFFIPSDAKVYYEDGLMFVRQNLGNRLRNGATSQYLSPTSYRSLPQSPTMHKSFSAQFLDFGAMLRAYYAVHNVRPSATHTYQWTDCVQTQTIPPDENPISPDRQQEIDKQSDEVRKLLEQRDPSQIDIITGIDTTERAVKAEMQYANPYQQVLGVTRFKYADDEQKTVEQTYSEYFDNNPFVKEVDLVNVKSTSYENIQIINNNQ